VCGADDRNHRILAVAREHGHGKVAAAPFKYGNATRNWSSLQTSKD
jgi:hypothetical protein